MATDLHKSVASEAVPTIRSVLGQPGVAKAFALSLIARLPATALGTLMVLRVSPIHGYTVAGVIIAIVAVSLAVAGPIWARLLDRLGATTVLATQSLVHGTALVGLALLPVGGHLVLFAVVGAIAGATEPVHGGAMRSLWDRMLSRKDERHVGYAMETASLEAMFAASNALFVGVIAALANAATALIAAALVAAIFGCWFASIPELRVWNDESEVAADDASDAPTSWLGALAHPGTRTVAVLAFGLGLHAGPIEIAITALGKSLGDDATVGVLLMIWGLGSMTAGVILTRVPPATQLARRMAWQLLWLASTSAALVFCSTFAVSAVLVFIVGTGLAPFFTTLNASFERVAAGESVAELYAIGMSGMLAGSMLSAPLAGALIDHASPQAGLLASSFGPFAALLVLLARRRDFAERA